jgi:hypothetical protein
MYFYYDYFLLSSLYIMVYYPVLQQLTKDLQRRRMDLSHQVKTITERSFSSSHLNKLAAQQELRPSPTGVAGA